MQPTNVVRPSQIPELVIEGNALVPVEESLHTDIPSVGGRTDTGVTENSGSLIEQFTSMIFSIFSKIIPSGSGDHTQQAHEIQSTQMSAVAKIGERNIRIKSAPADEVSDSIETLISDFVLEGILSKLFVGQSGQNGLSDLMKSRAVCRRWDRVVSQVCSKNQLCVGTAALSVIFRKSCRLRGSSWDIRQISVQLPPPCLQQIYFFKDMFGNSTQTRICEGLTRSLQTSKDFNKIKIIVGAVVDTLDFCPQFLNRGGYMQNIRSKQLQKDLIDVDPYYFMFLSPQEREDREIVLHAVKKKGNNLYWASDLLRADREIVLEAMSNGATCLSTVSLQLRDDREVVLKAVSNYGLVILYASSALQLDRGIALAAVQNNGESLQYLSDTFRDDEEICSVAVQTDGLGLKFASQAIRDNDAVVLKAVQNQSDALEYASVRLRTDKKFILAAIRNGIPLSGLHSFYYYVGEELQNDKEIALELVKIDKNFYRRLKRTLREDEEIKRAVEGFNFDD